MTTWKDAAACRDEDTELFFPAGHGAEFTRQIETAQKICGHCPVRAKCLNQAFDAPERYGIWGGLTEDERVRMRRRGQRRMRPAS